MNELMIGTAGFDNPGWKLIFYPEDLPRSDWFAYYCEYFPMFEINASFYKFPTESSMKAWYQKSPADFNFIVKAPRLITHFKKFTDCKREISEFYDACQNGLKEKLYAVLFQLPPGYSFSKERLELVKNSLSPGFRNIIEFRHTSWWIPEVYQALESMKITFCGVSYPNLPAEVIKTGAFGYYRLHGTPKLFYSGYETAELNRIYNEIVLQGFEEMAVCFNNTASERGILDAMTFQNVSDVK